MDLQQKNRPRLEPIREESEQEDDVERSQSGEREEEDFQAGGETTEVTAEDTEEEEEEEEEDEEDELRVLRPSRLSRSLSPALSLPRRSSANNHQEELESFSVSNSSDQATPPKQARLGHERRSSSGELRMKISKFRRQKHITPKPPVRKRENRKRSKKSSRVAEPFPEWLVDLMFNIEEATTHQLVVE